MFRPPLMVLVSLLPEEGSTCFPLLPYREGEGEKEGEGGKGRRGRDKNELPDKNLHNSHSPSVTFLPQDGRSDGGITMVFTVLIMLPRIMGITIIMMFLNPSPSPSL